MTSTSRSADARQPRSPTACARCIERGVAAPRRPAAARAGARRQPRRQPQHRRRRLPAARRSRRRRHARPRRHARRRPRRRRAGGLRAPTRVLRDVGTGNPDPDLHPRPVRALSRASPAAPCCTASRSSTPISSAGRASGWATDLAAATTHAASPITSGAADAVERLLAQALTRDDAVALEDPCFLASIHTVRARRATGPCPCPSTTRA